MFEKLKSRFKKSHLKDDSTNDISIIDSNNFTEDKPIELNPKQIALNDYYTALKNKDPEAMEYALLKVKKNCSQSNTNCLTEVFCPECPFGGLPVMSGRSGM